MSSAIDVWAAVAERVDRTRLRPRLAPDIETRVDEQAGGRREMILANPRTMAHLRLPPDEADLIPSFDGHTSVGQLVVNRLQASGALDPAKVVDLVSALEATNFLDHEYVDVYAAVEQRLTPTTWRTRAQSAVRTLSIEWSGADGLVRRLYNGGLKVCFMPAVFLLSTVVALAGLAAFLDVAITRDYALTGKRLGLGVAIVLLLDVAIVFIHELGHAAVLVHYGRRVKSAGFRLYFGAPAFFIDSSDVLMLDRRRRIVQGLGGPWAESVAAGAAALALWLFPHGPAARLLYQFTVINYFVLFLNLVPLLELDGYWVLADALRMPDLRSRSLTLFRHDLLHKLRARERLTKGEVGLAVYGLAGGAFTVFCLASAWFFWRRLFGDTVLRMWHGGLGGRLLLVVVTALLASPTLRAAADGLHSIAREVAARAAAIRFRFESAWRVEAAELLDRSGLFGDMPVDVLNDLAGRVRLRAVAPGEAVFRQGDRANAYYLVRGGTLEVVEEPVDGVGERRVLRTITRGEGFGEQALTQATVRTATVRAVERSQLFVLDKGTFDRLLAARLDGPEFALSLQQVADMRHLPPFANLGSDELSDVAQHGRWLTVRPGEELFRQGDRADGDGFYVIGSGRLEVVVDGRVVNTCGAGEHVGELALLFDQPRTATVRAATPARVYRLDAKGFEAVVASRFRRGELGRTVAVRGQEH